MFAAPLSYSHCMPTVRQAAGSRLVPPPPQLLQLQAGSPLPDAGQPLPDVVANGQSSSSSGLRGQLPAVQRPIRPAAPWSPTRDLLSAPNIPFQEVIKSTSSRPDTSLQVSPQQRLAAICSSLATRQQQATKVGVRLAAALEEAANTAAEQQVQRLQAQLQVLDQQQLLKQQQRKQRQRRQQQRQPQQQASRTGGAIQHQQYSTKLQRQQESTSLVAQQTPHSMSAQQHLHLQHEQQQQHQQQGEQDTKRQQQPCEQDQLQHASILAAAADIDWHLQMEQSSGCGKLNSSHCLASNVRLEPRVGRQCSLVEHEIHDHDDDGGPSSSNGGNTTSSSSSQQQGIHCAEQANVATSAARVLPVGGSNESVAAKCCQSAELTDIVSLSESWTCRGIAGHDRVSGSGSRHKSQPYSGTYAFDWSSVSFNGCLDNQQQPGWFLAQQSQRQQQQQQSVAYWQQVLHHILHGGVISGMFKWKGRIEAVRSTGSCQEGATASCPGQRLRVEQPCKLVALVV